MNKTERNEINSLPAKYRPLGAWAYFGYSILFSLPVIGFICMIVFAISDSNINRRSYARSFFCAIILGLIIAAILIVLAMTVLPGIMEQFTEMLSQYIPQ